ncbi:glycolate oxidase subunit GlcE [Alsobacter sp. SYSU M60028]|uniref:Glycolate oxidase subunit GlcE n=1 Tax=Alsobacter ponti TaxID=2962936 RepID=A0ABT1LE06_9HYPH|nr:glycolate oxidase subunit GlcE [Alsobacter ponti]MCP8939156.1 glycolate oxidase subunit GlcE [Alsobacter ponti]
MSDAAALAPAGALTPADETELAEAVASARAARAPLTVAGAGSKAGIGRPAQSARTLSTAALTGVTLYEPAEMVIGARAGTPLAVVEATLAERGQMLTFEPMDWRPLLGTTGEPTVGGTAAANVSGPRRIAAGACRDSLIGVRMVNGFGHIVKSGGRVMKNVTGLDLVKLAAGSWGTLGVFSEVIFKVLPAPAQVATLVLHGLDDARAVAALAAGLGSPFEVSGAAHLPASIERVPKTLLRLENVPESIAYRAGELRKLLRPFGSADLVTDDAAKAVWRAVRDATFVVEPRERAVWRVSIAPGKAASFVAALGGLPRQHFYDWGGGLVWLTTDAAGDAGASAIRAALAGTGGHATLARAPAELRAAVDVFQPLPEAMMRLTAGVKASFDPDAILNPGRMYAGV